MKDVLKNNELTIGDMQYFSIRPDMLIYAQLVVDVM